MAKKAISKTKSGKASGKTAIDLVRELANSIVNEGVVPAGWEISSIANSYMCAALERGNYRGSKLLENVMKVVEGIVVRLVRDKVNIDDMQFGFMPGRGTTDAMYLLRQL